MAGGPTERIRTLGHIAHLVNAGKDLGEVLSSVVTAVCQRTAWSSSAIMAVDETTKQSLLVARYDPMFATRSNSPERWALSTSPTRQVLKNRQPLVISDAQARGAFQGYREEATERDYRTVVLLPLGASDASGRGLVLSIHAHTVIEVDDEEIAFLETAATLASLAVERAHSEVLEKRQYQRLQTALAIHDIAMEQVLTSEDLESFADLANAHIGHPFILIDLTADLLRTGGGTSVTTESDRELFQTLAKRLKEKSLGKFDIIEELSVTLDGRPDARNAIVEPCVAGGNVLGGIVVVTDQPLDFAESATALEIRAALTVLLLRRHTRFEARAETLGEYFAHLFAGGWNDPRAIVARARHLGVPLDRPARLAALRVPVSDRNVRTDVLHALTRNLSRVVPGSSVFEHESEFVVFLPEGPEQRISPAKLMAQLLPSIEWISQVPSVACIGDMCREPADYPRARRDLDVLLKLAAKTTRTGVLDKKDLGPIERLVALSSAETLKKFVEETIGPLSENGGDQWIDTLHQYLLNNRHQQATADALGIHVTTLRYRLQRLTDVFGLDLNDPNVRLALEMALRVRDLTGLN